MFGGLHSLGGFKKRCQQNSLIFNIPRKKPPNNMQAKNITNLSVHNGTIPTINPYQTF